MRAMRLRTQLLLGYSFILAIGAALALFLIVQTQTLANQVATLNGTVTGQVLSAAQLSTQLTESQRATDRYLAQPQIENLVEVHLALQKLIALAHDKRTYPDDSAQRLRLFIVAQDITSYQHAFGALSNLILSQASTRQDAFRVATRTSIALQDTFSTYLRRRDPDAGTIFRFAVAQQSLQSAQNRFSELLVEQDATQLDRITTDLSTAKKSLALINTQGSNADRTVMTVILADVDTFGVLARQSADGFPKIQQQHLVMLQIQNEQLAGTVATITQKALQRLTNTRDDLEQRSAQAQQIALAALAATLLLAILMGLGMARAITRPLTAVVGATTQINRGNFTIAIAQAGGTEMRQLALAFNQMGATLEAQREAVDQQQHALADQHSELQHAFAHLRAANAEREMLAATVRAQSVPIIPILAQVILIPIVGNIDAERAQTLLARVLEGAIVHHARQVILDITGVPWIDQSVADTLLATAAALQLLGAQSVLVGVGPEVAQTFVAIDANLTQFTIRANLREAVEQTIRGQRV